MILNIHLEHCDDNGERLERLLKINKPLIISVVPVLLLPKHESFRNGIYPSGYYYPKRVVDILKDNADNPNLFFGQQGFTHYCPDCLKRKEERDPWHENRCLYDIEKTVKCQKAFMERGKRVIEKVLGSTPVLYVPPNHQFDKHSKIAAEKLGFKFFSVKKILDIKPYKEKKLIILPEGDLGEADIVYIHYDEIAKDFDKYLEIIENSKSIYEISPLKQSTDLISKNEKAIILKKKERDSKKQEKKLANRIAD